MKTLVRCTIAIAAAVILSGCEMSRGGAGQTTTGEPVVGEVWQNNAMEQGFTITSVNGWQCTGKLTKSQQYNATNSVITVPLTCSNNVTGTSLVAIDRFKSEADINFRLSNGKVGHLAIS
ncbi:hypothetical protein FGK63_14265 [Ruegeria sediminis]|uniref:Lipoprotein n=1 Tax=Ruegeria sediminis TaxID=2583820 RepID=A0ABY2WW37_9RHOB|nr:hypothetical protein [Ruegeria sediminis]TMV06319.1 hypothetical protein FGK63_14265 [Ruegeria sediminis]